MTTVVNNPTPVSENGGNSFLIGIVVLIGFVVVLIYFGIPAFRRMQRSQTVAPAPQIVIPDKINIDVNQTK
ncbi:MAG: hypothetical protein WCO78_01300 [Candidatus Roizmanbacteria bacterium]